MPREQPAGKGAEAWLGRRDLGVAGAVAAAALAIYVRTAYRQVPGGDAGELIGAVATGGVIHPPGYPLYALLGRLFAAIPGGSLAFRLALLSAVCGALAAGVLTLVLARWTGSRWAAVAGAALFAFAPGVWLYAVGAEVFALDNLCVALLLLLALGYGETRSRRLAYAAAGVFGLGLANHQTVLFTGVPVAAWILWRGREDWREPWRLVPLAAWFALGLTPYLELPLAGRHAALVSWGAPQTWSGFWTHLLRREYGTFRLSVLPGHADGAAMVGAFLRDLLAQVGWPGLALAAIGLAVALRAARREPSGFEALCLVPLLLSVGVFAALGNLPVGDPLHRDIVARFWQQPELYACGFGALGLAELGRRIAWRPLVPAVSVAAALLQPLVHFRALDRHASDLVESYGAEILRPLPPGTLLLTRGDLITNTVRYLQAVEGLRPDVRVVDRELLAFPWAVPRLAALHPELVFPGSRYAPGRPDGFSLAQLVAANLARAPIVICGGTSLGEDGPIEAFALWPLGLCETVRPTGEPVDVDRWVTESAAALPRIDFRGRLHPPGSWEDVVWGDIWAARQARALQLMAAAGHDPGRRRYLAQAAAILEGIVAENPAAPPPIWRSLAMVDGRLGLDTPEQRARAADAWRHYPAIAPAWDPGLPAIREELARLDAAGTTALPGAR